MEYKDLRVSRCYVFFASKHLKCIVRIVFLPRFPPGVVGMRGEGGGGGDPPKHNTTKVNQLNVIYQTRIRSFRPIFKSGLEKQGAAEFIF